MAVIGALALVGACSLNTQPIPPGVQAGAESDAATPSNTVGGGSDGSDGSFKGSDAGATPPDTDGGDAGDAGDADIADAADSGDQ